MQTSHVPPQERRLFQLLGRKHLFQLRIRGFHLHRRSLHLNRLYCRPNVQLGVHLTIGIHIQHEPGREELLKAGRR